MDFSYYKLFSYAWYDIFRIKGIHPETDYDKFLPLYEKVMKSLDPSRGSPSRYIYLAIYRMIAANTRANVALKPHKEQYKELCRSVDLVDEPETEALKKNAIKRAIDAAELTPLEAELVNSVLYKHRDIGISTIAKKLGRTYSRARGSELYLSALSKIKTASEKEGIRC